MGVKRRGGCPVLLDDDIQFLRDNYKALGPAQCARILNKNLSTIKAAAKRCGFSTDIMPGHPKIKIIYRINDQRALIFCKHHGVTEFYLRPSGGAECLIYRRQQQKFNYSTDKELCDHLERKRQQQNNKCSICSKSYDVVGYDIDHIIPVSSAISHEQLVALFDLSNLSLLCPTCNRYVKKDRLDVRYE